jgi:amino acid transporter
LTADIHPRVRLGALLLKSLALAFGIVIVFIALGYAFDQLTYLAAHGTYGAGDVVAILAMVALAFAGTALVAQLPESLRARFSRLPSQVRRRPVYGFGTMLAVGVGATLGSPLFILIPLNVEQYEFVSLLSLVLATLLSVGMAKVYADMYKVSKDLELGGVGGPSFTKLAWGGRSARYFISRVSMWVANTALAAYTKIVFLIFDFVFMPKILAAFGFSAEASTLIVYATAGAFIAWTVLNVLFEQRYLRALGLIQIVLTVVLLAVLVYHATALGGVGNWNLSGFLTPGQGVGWIPALVVNTGYLYLLFFGFQEIQALERDAVERSPLPIISWVRRGFTLSRTAYLGLAMVASVVVASAFNILYGVAVFSVHPTIAALQTSQIPALYLAENYLGPGQELLVGIAFLIATVTTFVPAFLAAARHLSALGEDGYMPESLASLSWVFTIVAIFLLAVGDQNFLVNITDFMVLVSLGMITVSAIWVKRSPGSKGSGGRVLPLVVGIGCFLFGGAVYFIDPTVVVFGSVAVIFAYLVFDIIELGSLGAQLFLSVFGFVCVAALGLFRHTIYASGLVLSISGVFGSDANNLLVWGLVFASVLLGANVLLDVRVLGRTSVS